MTKLSTGQKQRLYKIVLPMMAAVAFAVLIISIVGLVL